jgi:predicted Zn finger-like uncharacterized protein
MKLICPKCGAKYTIQDQNIPKRAATATCKKCEGKIKISPAAKHMERNKHIQSQSQPSEGEKSKPVNKPSKSTTAKNPHLLSRQVAGIVIASLVVLIFFRVGGVLVVLLGIFTFLDAWHSGIYKTPGLRSLVNVSPMGWGIGVMAFAIIFYPAYVFNRRKQKTKDGPLLYWVLTNVLGIIVVLLGVLYLMSLFSA